MTKQQGTYSRSIRVGTFSYVTHATYYFVFLFQQPFHCEIEHKIGLTCYTSGAVTCRVRLDRGGYVPGEAISIWATITNNSRVTIKHTRASLTEVSKK